MAVIGMGDKVMVVCVIVGYNKVGMMNSDLV